MNRLDVVGDMKIHVVIQSQKIQTELTSKSGPSDVTVPSHNQSVLLKNSSGIVIARGDLMEGRHL